MKNQKPVDRPTGTTKICFSYSRVSSGRQTTEDKTGIERQLQSAQRVVSSHPGWILDDKLSISDLGLSGYHKKNLTETAKLGALVKALKDGKIPAGRIMLIDDMSRLTRAEVMVAFHLFTDMIQNGLEIYVCNGDRHYTAQSLDNLTDLIIILVDITAARKYAADLGKNVKAAWKIKKQRFVETGKPYKYKAPSWLKWNDETQSYDLIPEKAASVKRIFVLAGMGLGVRGIAKRLNREGVPIISTYCGNKTKSKSWNAAIINTIIKQKKVLGCNEDVSPASQMYPAVVSEKLYYTARTKLDERRTNKLYGRNSDKVNNLFSGLVKCSKCESSLHYSHHHKLVHGCKPHPYLICGGTGIGICSNSNIRYDQVEESFAMMLSGSNFVNAYGETRPEQGSQIDTLKGKIADTHTRLEEFAVDYEKSPSDILAGLMTKTETTEKELKQELENATTLSVGSSPLADTRNELLAILYKGWYDVDVRLKLRELIRAVVEKIIINGPDRTYTIHWKNKAKPTMVEIFKKAYRIDGLLVPAIPDWEKNMVLAAEVIKQREEKYKIDPNAKRIEDDDIAANLALLQKAIAGNATLPKPIEVKKVKPVKQIVEDKVPKNIFRQLTGRVKVKV